MPGPFTKLVAYQRAAEVADDLYVSVRRWPTADQIGCGDQLIRAIDSVGANIAESAGRRHVREKRQFLRIARASLMKPSTG